jgi:hypothetical protein
VEGLTATSERQSVQSPAGGMSLPLLKFSGGSVDGYAI